MISSFEWMVALRYLRSRRSDGFISVIAGFSLVGICLGVAVLIIVMSVMNGFREELMSRILGLNGHVVVQGYGGQLRDYDDLPSGCASFPALNRSHLWFTARRWRAIRGLRRAPQSGVSISGFFNPIPSFPPM